MRDFYDVVVVGGGPGGSWAARHAAMGGASVLLLEKDREIGLPVRCAEGTDLGGLKQLLPEIKDEWVSQVVDKAQVVAPDGRFVDGFTGDKGLVLHRRLFDPALAAMAAEAGAEIQTKAYVFGLIKNGDQICGVKVRHLGEEKKVGASIVIGADGIESRVGRWGGIDTAVPMHEMESCAQATLTNIDIDPQTAIFWIGSEVAPMGYAWMFPKGEGWANVGLGISGKYSAKKRAIDYLNDFIDKVYPGAAVLNLVAGGVPSTRQLSDLVRGGLMLVGDAARQTDPLTGGGITNAMFAGEFAGKTAAEAVNEKDFSKKSLERYSKRWGKQRAKSVDLAYRIKNVVFKFSDDDYNKQTRPEHNPLSKNCGENSSQSHGHKRPDHSLSLAVSHGKRLFSCCPVTFYIGQHGIEGHCCITAKIYQTS